jgi:outer membrane protein assembly factor BamB
MMRSYTPRVPLDSRKVPFMLRFCGLCLTLSLSVHGVLSAAEKIDISTQDWPWWRGPSRNGVAPADQQPPLHWSETDGVVWQSPLPGRGHGSPIVVGEQVLLATAEPDREVQSVVCYHRATGAVVWQTAVHTGGFEKKMNEKSTQANSTLACDGRHIYANFLHNGAIYTTALDRDGKQVWQTKVADYILHQGFSSSPAIYESLVIVSADNKGTGTIAGLERATGRIVWKHTRPAKPNYTSPMIFHVAGRDQLFFTGCDLVTSLDPLTGKTHWEIEGATTECVTSTLTDGQLIFTSGGYPKNHLSAVRADGSGKVVWENGSRVYVPSLLIRNGHLYAVLDAGVAMCWNSATGEEMWKHRLGGTFSSSPVLVGDRIYATNEAGQTFVFAASPAGFELLAENQLGSEVFATPAVCGSRVYHRAATQVDGKRQEFVYCLGAKENH